MLACSLALLVTRVHFLGVGRDVRVLSTSVHRTDLHSTAANSSPASLFEVGGSADKILPPGTVVEGGSAGPVPVL